MAIGVRIDKKREKELADTTVKTPFGTVITVTKSRAAALVARPPVRFNDQVARSYVVGDEDTDNETPIVSKANPPRRGDRTNSPEGSDK